MCGWGRSHTHTLVLTAERPRPGRLWVIVSTWCGVCHSHPLDCSSDSAPSRCTWAIPQLCTRQLELQTYVTGSECAAHGLTSADLWEFSFEFVFHFSCWSVHHAMSRKPLSSQTQDADCIICFPQNGSSSWVYFCPSHNSRNYLGFLLLLLPLHSNQIPKPDCLVSFLVNLSISMPLYTAIFFSLETAGVISLDFLPSPHPLQPVFQTAVRVIPLEANWIMSFLC